MPGPRPAADGPAPRRASPAKDDLVSALVNLGYSRPEAERGVERALRDDAGRPLRGPPAARPPATLGPLSEGPMTDPASSPAARPTTTLGFDQSLRPRRLDEYVGQPQVIANLRVAIEAARSRGEALDHVLLFGPPGRRQDQPRPRDRRRARGADQGHRRARSSSAPATSPRSSRRSSRARSSSSTRSTGSTPRSRRSSTPRSRTRASTS